MRLHALNQDRAGVQRVYQDCIAILQGELATSPSLATQAAYERFLNVAIPAAQRHNLPAQATLFVGREDELAQVTKLLANPACRLLTLVGPGGSGKTCLAIQAAFHMLIEQTECFSHGLYFVPLAGLSSPEFIVPAIAEAMKFSFPGQEPLKTQLLNHFRQMKGDLLLLLDNFEHLREGAGLLAEILEQAPQVTLLVTSRQRLNLQGEWVLDLRGLKYPTGSLTGEEPESYSALALFIQHARQVDLNFQLSDQEYPFIAHICRLVEGLPLAIILAATWVRLLSCREIAQEIEQSLDFLTSAWPDVPERHRSMRAVFDHSWRLLSPVEQRLLQQLSVFRGGCRREAAEQVAGASTPLLAALLDKAFLQRNSAGRYELHELVRQYAAGKLRQAGQLEETQNRHLAFFLELARLAEPGLESPDRKRWLDCLEHDHDNLRAALTWALEHDPPAALKLAAALAPFWDTHGHLSEGRNWLETALRASPAPSLARAKALMWAGTFARQQSDLERANIFCQEALGLYQEGQDQAGVAHTLRTMAWIYNRSDNGPHAIQLLKESLAIFRQLGHKRPIAQTLTDLAWLTLQQGANDQATAYFQGSLALFRALADSQGIAYALNGLGELASLAGDHTTAMTLQTESLGLFQELGNKRDAAWSLCGLGETAWHQGNYALARSHCQASRALFEELGIPSGLLIVLHHLAQVERKEGNLSLAAHYYTQSLAMSQATNRKSMIARCLAGLGGLALSQRQPERAARLLGAAYLLFETLPPFLSPADRAEYDQLVNMARGQLGEAAFAAAWAGGRAQPLDQVIAKALVVTP